ncbi:hypothetical protein AB0F61_33605, partial [Micromonospora sp. NPDC023888]
AVHAELDVVFPVLHGPFGEDGVVQGLLESLNDGGLVRGTTAARARHDGHPLRGTTAARSAARRAVGATLPVHVGRPVLDRR